MMSAVILAAGLSRRMRQPKMVMPWGQTTVIGQVVSVLAQAGIQDILVVTGGARRQVEKALVDLPTRTIFNPHFAEDDMAVSLQVGLSSLSEDVQAAMVALGDQPQIQLQVVDAVLCAYRKSHAPLVVPSYQMRRGHPWLIARSLWDQVIALKPPKTLRDVIKHNAQKIHYVKVDTGSILQDLDTPSDYDRECPRT